MDAQALLIADHNRVRGLFARFKKAHDADDTTTATELVTKITEELEIHTTIEEELYYPAVQDASDKVHELIAEGLQEHHVAKQLLAELGSVEAGGEEWTAKVQVLIEAIEHHAKEEEEEMFPKVRTAVGNERLTELGEKMAQRKLKLGAPPPAIDLTMEELKSLASDQEIPGRSKMKREELAATIDPRG